MKNYICQICQSFYNPLYALQFDELIKKGLDCKVFYFTTYENQQRMIDRNYAQEYKAYKNIHRLFFLYKEKCILKAYKDFIEKNGLPSENHAHTLFTAGYIAYVAKEEYNIPYVVSVRNVDINHFFKKRPLLRQLGYKILKNASAIIFLSNTAKKQTLAMFNNDVELLNKSAVITNGLDRFWIENKSVHVKQDREKIRVIYYGDINRNKNVVTSVKALDLLINKGTDIEFTIIGKIHDKKILDIIKRDYVHIEDFMPKEELIKRIRQHDIFLMPSISETFGLAYLESMSQGLPVIYSKSQGFDGLFEDGYVGYSVDPLSATDIAESIEKICHQYDRISKNAFNSVSDFDWEIIAQKLMGLYII